MDGVVIPRSNFWGADWQIRPGSCHITKHGQKHPLRPIAGGARRWISAVSVSPVAVVPILPTPFFTPVAALMFPCQSVVALGMLISQITMYIAMLPTAQALFVSLLMLIF